MNHEKIQSRITGLLEKLGFAGNDVSMTYDEKANTLWFSITSPHTRLLFTRDAEALVALNHLATKLVEQELRDVVGHPRVVVDANNFEKKKIDNLRSVAHMMAERARYFKSSIDVEPMSAHDRRIIHEFLSEIPDVKTESTGDGKNRHIVIKYIGEL